MYINISEYNEFLIETFALNNVHHNHNIISELPIGDISCRYENINSTLNLLVLSPINMRVYGYGQN